MSEILKQTPSLFIIVGCVSIMQVHSINFWLSTTADYGALFSLMLELAALWHWWHKKIIVGAIISLILITGPLAEISKPLIKDFQEAKINERILALNDASIEENKAIMKKLLTTQWAGTIINTIKTKQSMENRQVLLLQEQKKGTLTWQSMSFMLLQALALIVLMITQIHILQVLRQRYDRYYFQEQSKLVNAFPCTGNVSEIVSEKKSESDLMTLANRIFIKLSQYKDGLNGNWKLVSEHLNIPQSNITRVKNLIEGKADAASMDMLAKIDDKLNSSNFFKEK